MVGSVDAGGDGYRVLGSVGGDDVGSFLVSQPQGRSLLAGQVQVVEREGCLAICLEDELTVLACSAPRGFLL